jgi:hypothetical protein
VGFFYVLAHELQIVYNDWLEPIIIHPVNPDQIPEKNKNKFGRIE